MKKVLVLLLDDALTVVRDILVVVAGVITAIRLITML